MTDSRIDALFKQMAGHLQSAEYLLQFHLHEHQPGATSAFLVRNAIGKMRDAQETARVAMGLKAEVLHQPDSRGDRVDLGSASPPTANADRPQGLASMLNETFADFCIRLRERARQFEARTGTHFHLLRAQPAHGMARLMGLRFEFQAVISGGVDSMEGALKGVGFDVENARPVHHPRLCMEFDSIEALEANFAGTALERGRVIFQFGEMDANPGARVLIQDPDFRFLGLMHRLNPRDPGLAEARAIGRSSLAHSLEHLVSRLEGRHQEPPTSWHSAGPDLEALLPLIRFTEGVEQRTGTGRGQTQLVAHIERLVSAIRDAGYTDPRGELLEGLKRVVQQADRARFATPHIPAPAPGPSFGMG